MDAFSDSIFIAGPPSLVLRPSAKSKPGANTDPRPGLMDERTVRDAVAAHAGTLVKKPATENLRILEGLSLLWHDHWNPAHEIAQAREGEPDSDLLHAILHRREGDFSNAGYWFLGAGKHPCYPMLERRLTALSDAGTVISIPGGGGWSSKAFLAKVRKHAGESGEAARDLMRIQAEEFRAFADYLLRS